MDIRKQLLSDHSKSNTDEIVFFLLENPERLNELMEAFFSKDRLLQQRAAWVVGEMGRAEPAMIEPYHHKMIAHLKAPDLHDAVKRNTIRYLSESTIEEELWGEAYDLAIRCLSSNHEKIAIKVFSMTLALNIVKKIPELKEELRYLIEEQMPYGSPGFKNRGTKTLTVLGKL